MSLYLLMLWPCFCAAAVEIVPGMRRFGDRSERLYDMFALIGFITQLLQSAFLLTEDITIAIPILGGIVFRFYGFGGIMCIVLSAVCVLLVPIIRAHGNLVPSRRGRLYSFMLLSLAVATCIFTAVDFMTLTVLMLLLVPFTAPIMAASHKEKSRTAVIVYVAVSVYSTVMVYGGTAIIGNQIGAVAFSTVYTFSSLVNSSAMAQAMLHILVGVCVYSCTPFVLNLVLRKGKSSLQLAGEIFPMLCGMYILSMTTAGLGASDCANAVMIIGCVMACVPAICALIFRDFKPIFSCMCLSVCGVTVFSCGTYMLTSSRNSLAAIILNLICGSFLVLLANEITAFVESTANTTLIRKLRGAGKGNVIFEFALVSLCLGYSSIPSWSGYIIISLLCDSLNEYGSVIFPYVAIGYSALCLAVGLYIAITVCVQNPTENNTVEGNQSVSELSPTALIPAIILPAFGILPGLLTAKTVNFVLVSLRAGSISGIRLFNGELLTGAFIALIAGVLIYALIRKK